MRAPRGGKGGATAAGCARWEPRGTAFRMARPSAIPTRQPGAVAWRAFAAPPARALHSAAGEEAHMDAKLWSDMFHLGVPVAEKMLRPVVVYAFLVVGLRLAGKRELAQLNPFDLIVLLTLSNTVQNAIIGDDNSVTGGLLGAATLLLANYLVVRFLYRHERLERLVEGEPDVLIENGTVRFDRLKAQLITLPELESAAHKQGLESLD